MGKRPEKTRTRPSSPGPRLLSVCHLRALSGARLAATFLEENFASDFRAVSAHIFARLKSEKISKPVARSGRFLSGVGADVAQFTESISFDWRLWRHDIMGSEAHARMLSEAGLLSGSELRDILRGLREISDEIESGRFKWDPALEDVHMNIESELTRRYPAGAKLHTGRSRNDQVALDLRLWVRDECAVLRSAIVGLQKALVDFGLREAEVIIPGYTHMQRAQPVYLAHHLLAYVEMLDRDQARLSDCVDRLNECPLGSGALAGSTLPLDREYVAKSLGFVDAKGRPRLSRNSMDAVGDRDFVVEFCSAAALVGVHLSRLAEDIVLWAGSEFNYIRISDAYTTGSSLMPQKKNPDVAELIRGKSGRVVGNLMAMLTLLKGLPLTYNRDLQEDKERLFDTADTVRACVRLAAAMLNHTSANRQACLAAASDPALLATELADYLVRKGIPFRHAHHAVGAVVALADKENKPLNQVTPEQLRSAHPEFGPDALEALSLEQALSRRRLPGSPGTALVRKELARWKKLLE